MLALYSMLLPLCYAQNYAGIIGSSLLNINLCKKSILPTLKDFGNSIIYCHICEAIKVFMDTIINTVKFGIGEINNQSPFTLLMMFGNYSKSANVGIRAGVFVIGACYSMTEYLSCKVTFDYFWVKKSAFQVLVWVQLIVVCLP